MPELPHWSPEARLREIHAECGDDDAVVFLAKVSEEFNWTISQSYIATEFLYRPENFN